MNKDTMSKAVVLSVIFLFIIMSVVPSVNAISVVKLYNQYEKGTRDVKSIEGLPDLVITKISVDAVWVANDYEWKAFARVKNLGLDVAQGYINTNCKVYQRVRSNYTLISTDADRYFIYLESGKYKDLMVDSYVPTDLGLDFYKVIVKINIDKKLEELTYINNAGLQRFTDFHWGVVSDWWRLGILLLRPLTFQHFGL